MKNIINIYHILREENLINEDVQEEQICNNKLINSEQEYKQDVYLYDYIKKSIDIFNQKKTNSAYIKNMLPITQNNESKMNIEESSVSNKTTRESVLQIVQNGFRDVELMLFDIRIITDRILVRIEQAGNYITNYKIIKVEDISELTQSNFIVEDIIKSIHELYNIVSQVTGHPQKNYVIINCTIMNLNKLQQLINDVIPLIRNLKYYTERLLQDIRYRYSQLNSDSFESMFYDNKDKLTSFMFRTCQELYQIASPYIVTDDLKNVSYKLDTNLYVDSSYAGNLLPTFNLHLKKSSTNNSSIEDFWQCMQDSLSRNMCNHSHELTQIVNDPYICEFVMQDYHNVESDDWHGLITEENIFFFNNYNKQFSTITNVDVKDVKFELASNNYKPFQTPLNYMGASHILELYDFPSDFSDIDIELIFYEYFKNNKAVFHWVTQTSGLLDLKTNKNVKYILNRPWLNVRIRKIVNASKMAQTKCWIMGLE